MKTLEMLMSTNYVSEPELEPVVTQIHRFTVKENQGTKSIIKTLAAVDLHTSLLNYPQVC